MSIYPPPAPPDTAQLAEPATETHFRDGQIVGFARGSEFSVYSHAWRIAAATD